MPIVVGSIHAGNKPIKEVYAGSRKVWSRESWDFFDDFERSSIGSAWQGSGGIIENGALKKNTSAGTARYMINQRFDSDDITVEVVIGTTQDAQQTAVIIVGDPDGHFVALSFSKNRFHAFGFDGGWPGYGDFPNRPMADGDKIKLARSGTLFTVSYNDNVVGTFTSTLARGAAFRKVAVEVKMDINFFVRWYGPTIDAIRVRAN